jgi:hypothetical protein
VTGLNSSTEYQVSVQEVCHRHDFFKTSNDTIYTKADNETVASNPTRFVLDSSIFSGPNVTMDRPPTLLIVKTRPRPADSVTGVNLDIDFYTFTVDWSPGVHTWDCNWYAWRVEYRPKYSWTQSDIGSPNNMLEQYKTDDTTQWLEAAHCTGLTPYEMFRQSEEWVVWRWPAPIDTGPMANCTNATLEQYNLTFQELELSHDLSNYSDPVVLDYLKCVRIFIDDGLLNVTFDLNVTNETQQNETYNTTSTTTTSTWWDGWIRNKQINIEKYFAYWSEDRINGTSCTINHLRSSTFYDLRLTEWCVDSRANSIPVYKEIFTPVRQADRPYYPQATASYSWIYLRWVAGAETYDCDFLAWIVEYRPVRTSSTMPVKHGWTESPQCNVLWTSTTTTSTTSVAEIIISAALFFDPNGTNDSNQSDVPISPGVTGTVVDESTGNVIDISTGTVVGRIEQLIHLGNGTYRWNNYSYNISTTGEKELLNNRSATECNVTDLVRNVLYEFRIWESCKDPRANSEIVHWPKHIWTRYVETSAPTGIRLADVEPKGFDFLTVTWTPGEIQGDCVFQAWLVEYYEYKYPPPCTKQTWCDPDAQTPDATPESKETWYYDTYTNPYWTNVSSCLDDPDNLGPLAFPRSSCRVTGLKRSTEYVFRVRQLCTDPWLNSLPTYSKGHKQADKPPVGYPYPEPFRTLFETASAPHHLEIRDAGYDWMHVSWLAGTTPPKQVGFSSGDCKFMAWRVEYRPKDAGIDRSGEGKFWWMSFYLPIHRG